MNWRLHLPYWVALVFVGTCCWVGGRESGLTSGREAGIEHAVEVLVFWDDDPDPFIRRSNWNIREHMIETHRD